MYTFGFDPVISPIGTPVSLKGYNYDFQSHSPYSSEGNILGAEGNLLYYDAITDRGNSGSQVVVLESRWFDSLPVDI
jgi:V8-like Glu-specific endopeptidase